MAGERTVTQPPQPLEKARRTVSGSAALLKLRVLWSRGWIGRTAGDDAPTDAGSDGAYAVDAARIQAQKWRP